MALARGNKLVELINTIKHPSTRMNCEVLLGSLQPIDLRPIHPGPPLLKASNRDGRFDDFSLSQTKYLRSVINTYQ